MVHFYVCKGLCIAIRGNQWTVAVYASMLWWYEVTMSLLTEKTKICSIQISFFFWIFQSLFLVCLSPVLYMQQLSYRTLSNPRAQLPTASITFVTGYLQELEIWTVQMPCCKHTRTRTDGYFNRNSFKRILVKTLISELAGFWIFKINKKSAHENHFFFFQNHFGGQKKLHKSQITNHNP